MTKYIIFSISIIFIILPLYEALPSPFPECSSWTSYPYYHCTLCRGGYYLTGSGGSESCPPCKTGCKECTNSSNCSECWYNYRQVGNNCHQCDFPYCRSCSVTTTQCTQCFGNDRSTVAPLCSCNPGFYDDGSTKDCQPCDGNCAKCETNPTHCTECVFGKVLISNQCETCHHKCNGCTTDTTTCINCTGLNRLPLAQQCQCNDGFFDDGSNSNCQPCSSNCQNCDISTCLNCMPNYRLNGSICEQCTNIYCKKCDSDINICSECYGANRSTIAPDCLCNTGFYDDGVSKDCQPCDGNCLKCENSSTECTECEHGKVLLGTQCQPCSYQCDGCITDQNTCQNCNGLNRLTPDQCLCEDEYFDDGSSSDCQPCVAPCKNCDKNQCLSCVDGYYYQSNACFPCNYTCKTCQNDEFTCLSCEGLERSLNGSDCICNPKFYDDGLNKDCSTCLPPCDTCTKDHCLSCLDGHYFDSNQCHSCNYSCNTCENNDSTCTSCNGIGRTLDSSSCICDSGFYDDGSNKDCQACTFPFCKNCTVTSCSECLEAYYLDGSNQCQKCDPKCKNCHGSPENCTECQGLNRNMQFPECLCLTGFFDDNTQSDCQECSHKCTSCESTAENCTQCSEFRVNKPQCECQDGYFQSLYNNECQICDLKCETCSINSTSCLQCKQNSDNLLPPPICTCKPQTFQNNGICEDCEPKCSSCENSANSCTICSPSLTRKNEAPNCPCMEGFFEPSLAEQYSNNSHECIPCPPQCKSCSNNGQCTECLNDQLLLPDCQMPNKGKYQKIIINDENMQYISKNCEKKCETCTENKSHCTQCQVSRNRVQYPPECPCKDGYHDENGTLQNCIKCNNTCQQCLNSIQCTQCIPELNRYLNPLSGKCDCIEGYQSELSKKECKKCYYFKGTCTFYCPNSTVANNETYECEHMELDIKTNYLLYIICGLILSLILFTLLILIPRNFLSNIQKKNIYQGQNINKLELEV